MKILNARKVLDTEYYIPAKALSCSLVVARLQEAIDSSKATVWTHDNGRKLLLAAPCNAQIWVDGMGRYDVQLEEQ